MRFSAHGVVHRSHSAYDAPVSSRVHLVLALNILWHCACSGPESQSESRPNILLITLDTTRADHLGCYGYEKAQTPNIDELAETGVLFENAGCQAPSFLRKRLRAASSLRP